MQLPTLGSAKNAFFNTAKYLALPASTALSYYSYYNQQKAERAHAEFTHVLSDNLPPDFYSPAIWQEVRNLSELLDNSTFSSQLAFYATITTCLFMYYYLVKNSEGNDLMLAEPDRPFNSRPSESDHTNTSEGDVSSPNTRFKNI